MTVFDAAHEIYMENLRRYPKGREFDLQTEKEAATQCVQIANAMRTEALRLMEETTDLPKEHAAIIRLMEQLGNPSTAHEFDDDTDDDYDEHGRPVHPE